MPRFNQSTQGEYYITHRFRSGEEEVLKNYKLSDFGADLLLEKGYKSGDTIQTALFHELRIQGHIFNGLQPVHPPAEVARQQYLTQMVSNFFEVFDDGQMSSSDAAETFGRHILSQIHMVSHALSKEMLASIAGKIQDRLEQPENANLETLLILRQKILESAPSNVAGTLRMIFHL
jgi:hypothetical protein